MKELTKKVVILNNFSSPYVSQAIIVLRDYNPKLEGRVISEAEQIVSRYIEKMPKNGQSKRTVRKKSKTLKFVAGLILTAVICAVIRHII